MPRTIAIVTREHARRHGLSKYFTGRPCKHGHVCERWVKHPWCLECKQAGLKWDPPPPAEKVFTGKPCKRGHIGERYVNSGGCVQCSQENNKEQIARQKRERERYRAKIAEALKAGPELFLGVMMRRADTE